MSNRGGSTPITLLPWASLSGTVTKDGKPAEGVNVSVSITEFFEPGEDNTYHASRHEHLRGVLQVEVPAKTDQRGRWLIDKLPAGTYRVKTAGADTISVRLDAGKQKNLATRIK